MADSSTLVDRVKIFVESSGTGPFQLGNALPAFRGSEALVDGLTYSYAVESGSDYEVGQGVYVLAVDQLIRAPTLSSNGGAPVSFPANVAVNFTALAADLVAGLAGSGTVTSVQGSGGTTGLTLTGGPITGAGTLTLGGTLGLANGGTGGTDGPTARTGLGLGNVDNTSDADKPISTATQTALDTKVDLADLASATGAGMVGNELPVGTDIRVQTVAERINAGVLQPSQFAGTEEQQLVRAITEANTARDSSIGQTVQLPRGEITVAASFNVGNRCSLVGVNKRGSRIVAAGGHAGPYVVTITNGTTSTFDNALERLTVDCQDITGLGGVEADAWQEGGGLRNVLVQKFRTYGVHIQNGYGGASTCLISQSEFFGSASGGGATAAIKCEQISLVGNFLLHVTDCTIVGGGAGAELDYGIQMVKDSLICNVTHFEDAVTGVYLDGVGHHILTGITGNATVTNLVEIAATFTGSLEMVGCYRGGATNFVKDNRSGGFGTITGYDIPRFSISPEPPLAIGANVAGGSFDGTSAPTVSDCFGASSIVRNSVGNYTVQLARAALATASFSILGSSNLAGGGVQCFLIGSGSVGLIVRNAAGNATDSNEVKFLVVRTT